MFEKILIKLGKCLKKYKIPYMIIGGQAVLLYGEPRLTRDIDIALGVNIDEINKLLLIMQELSLMPIPNDLEAFVQQTMVMPVMDENTGIRIDFIFSLTPYERQAINRSKKIKIARQDVCFASPEDVIIHKIFAGRPRDIEDTRSILLKNPKIDIKYIRKWLKEFDVSSDEKHFLKDFENILSEENT